MAFFDIFDKKPENPFLLNLHAGTSTLLHPEIQLIDGGDEDEQRE